MRTSTTASSRTIAAALLAALPLSGCATRETPPAPTGPGPITPAAPDSPPDLPLQAGEQSELSPPSGQRPPRYENIESPTDIPPPPAPAPVFTPQPPAPQAGGLREVFPNVRIDPLARLVEFDGAVAWDVHDPQTPMTYLELVVCTPDTKEYESLVVSRARPSNVHAAILLLGLEPGKPGSFTWEGEQIKPVPPTGPPLEVTFVLNAGQAGETAVDPLAWIVSAADNKPFADHEPPAAQRSGWLFTGSRIVRRDVGQGEQDFYLADGDDGSLVGLTTFGSETIGWRRVISPDSSIEEPEWIANVAAMPKVDTPVVVRLRPLNQPAPAPPTAAAP